MKALVAGTTLLLLLAAPAAAQKMGSTNRSAPRIEQSIQLGAAGKVTLNYIGITWGGGRWAESLESEETRAEMRGHINQAADRSPIGNLEVENDVTIGSTSVPAGNYKLSFKLDEDFNWQMNLSGDETITIPLELMEGEEHSTRLVVALYAGEEDGTAGVYLSFGNRMGMLTIAPAADEESQQG